MQQRASQNFCGRTDASVAPTQTGTVEGPGTTRTTSRRQIESPYAQSWVFRSHHAITGIRVE
eukprot:837066-Rhodomonas_salina.2